MKSLGKRHLAVLAAMTCLWALVAAGAAQANTITVGSVLPPGPTSEPVGEVQTFLNTALPEKGASISSPTNGTIVRWRLQGAKGGPFYLRVLHPNGVGAYTAVGTSDPVLVNDTGLHTFNANLPIHSGDLLAVDPTNASDELGFATVAGAAFTTIFPTPFEGATVPGREPKSGTEIELSAEVQPVPTVSGIDPDSGSVTGGATVTITGANLTGASAVKFGTVAATSFKVESDTEIVATAPKRSKTGSVDVTVTTLAGTSATVGGDRFAYRGCVVPKLKGKKLGRAKQLLNAGNCKLGKVTTKAGVSRSAGRVVNQSPGAGKVIAPGHKVNVRLG
jgi:hypothetical protein